MPKGPLVSPGSRYVAPMRVHTGFRGAAGAFAGGAKLLFAVFLTVFLLALFF
jgi:uncharacterized membrane protein YtjA (UPF0391 family)